jgi:hypothetical protein
MHRQSFDVIGRQVDDFGQQKHLGGQRPGMHCHLQRLVDETLVGSMLIDDDQRIGGLCDNIIAMYLRPRRTKRIVDDFRLSPVAGRTDVGARRGPTVNSACARS